jgi:hypothetical protein
MAPAKTTIKLPTAVFINCLYTVGPPLKPIVEGNAGRDGTEPDECSPHLVNSDTADTLAIGIGLCNNESVV